VVLGTEFFYALAEDVGVGLAGGLFMMVVEVFQGGRALVQIEGTVLFALQHYVVNL
jgi:hypothetical protein